MAQGTCSIPECGTYGRLARTWCLKHYARWRATGTTDDPVPLTVEQRWLAKVDKNGPIPAFRPSLGPCWIWTGWTNADGYGVFVLGELQSVDGKRRKQKVLAHRWGFENFAEPIASDLDIDHLCRVPACVNYEGHIEPATRLENMLRGFTLGAYNAGKLECIRGHQLESPNVRLTSKGHRSCIKCARIRQAERPKRDWRRGGTRGKRLVPPVP